MKRVALIAGVSLAALLAAGPTSVRALPGDINGWSNGLHFSTAPSTTEPSQKPSRRHLRSGDRTSRKSEPADKAPPIPNGPLAIIVSIDKQRAILYADGQPIASTAVSTGTAQHPTPMGVFSVIQKDRHHVSNLYNASMPYMQRITWSGSALHEGPLPGYPASHGCVRLTSSFAQMLWRTTKMGARVIVTHPDVSPVEFESPRLFVPRPKLVEASPPIVPVHLVVPAAAPAVEPAVATVPAAEPAPAAAPVTVAEPALTSGIAKVRTADASNTTAVLSVIGNASKPVATSVVTEPTPNNPSAEQPTKLSETEGTGNSPKASDTQADAAEAQPVEAKPAEAAVAETGPVVEDKPAAEVKPTETQAVETKPAEAAVAETKPVVEDKPVAEVKPVETKAAVIPATEAKPPMIAAPAPIIVDERPKSMPAAVVQEANGRPISVFVSLKEGKLYVRQGWKPLFEAPVSFENPTQPIGTHVYTAMGVKAGGPDLRWTVISIPSGYHRHVAELRSERGRKSHGEHPVKIAEIEPAVPPTPSAALDRIIMPPELIERISAMITPGSSLIVSDNRLSDETGEYTDFIVTTR